MFSVASSCRNVPINTRHPAAPCTYRVLYTFQPKLPNAKSRKWGARKGENKKTFKACICSSLSWILQRTGFPPLPTPPHPRRVKRCKEEPTFFFLSFSDHPSPSAQFLLRSLGTGAGFSLRVSLHGKKTRTLPRRRHAVPPRARWSAFHPAKGRL